MTREQIEPGGFCFHRTLRATARLCRGLPTPDAPVPVIARSTCAKCGATVEVRVA
jgi:hypothetical protein